ncbi:hypothetical protein BK675_02515 [Pseudomonas fluorescens]|nr:hypothetical protein BK675_02515 [Pseudomonas fluorescens]ROO19870.1 hypothetical protein BK676_04545 [Pseudomonas fluorescens]
MTSPVGRFVEMASYIDLLLFAGLIVLGSSIYFVLAPCGHGLNIQKIEFVDAVYFVLVTFTSLGYGDFTPQGFGRAVAVGNVVCGLIFVALLIGKVASERQHSILVLLYSSDCQRRIKGFGFEFKCSCKEIDLALQAHDVGRLRGSMKDLVAKLEALSSYLVFNANQAKLVKYGSDSSFSYLYSELEFVQKKSISVYKSGVADASVGRMASMVIHRSVGIVKLMRVFHSEKALEKSYSGALFNWLRGWLFSSEAEEPRPVKHVRIVQARMTGEVQLLHRWRFTNYTDLTAEKLWRLCPSGKPRDWPKGLNKILAQQLEISNTLAQKCLDRLLQLGRLPKL